MRPREIVFLAGLVAVAFVFWSSWLLYPVKVFVVLLHELGHGVAAVLTGGEVVRIEISSDLGGVCWSRGGWRLAVLPAGYLGSMLFGGLILVAASRLQQDAWLAAGMGVGVLALTGALVRTLFGVLFGLLFGAALLLAAWGLPRTADDLLVKFLGLTSILYAVIDIKEDLLARTVPGSDAYAMSRELFFPPVFWGGLWMLLALAAAAMFLALAMRGSES